MDWSNWLDRIYWKYRYYRMDRNNRIYWFYWNYR